MNTTAPKSHAALLLAVTALLVIGLGLFADGAAAKRRAAQPVAPPQLRGINLSPNQAFVPPPIGLSSADDSREVASACQLGAGVVRVFVTWYLLEPLQGVVDPDYAGHLSSLMTQANQCHIKVMMMLLGTPKWATIGSPTDKYFGAYPSKHGAGDYGWMVATMLRTFPDLYALEVWNEPNLPAYWRGSAQDYADMVNAAVDAKRSAGSSTQIVAGALSLGGTDYLRQLYADGMRGQDDISVHPYAMSCSQSCNRFYDPADPAGPFRGAIEGVHQAMAQNHDPAGLWLTEFGYSSCPSQPICVDDSTQAQWLAKSIRVADCYPYVRGLTAFTLRDRSVPPSWDQSSWHFHFGLMSPDFSPKPAFTALRDTYSQLDRSDARITRLVASRKARRRRARAAQVANRKCRGLLGSARVSKKHAKRHDNHRRHRRG